MSQKTKPYLIIFIITIAIGIVLGYAYFRTINLIKGPYIQVSTPEDGGVLNESLIPVGGYTRNITELTLNNRPIFINEEGIFSEEILLSYGYNVIELRAKDKFGRSTTEQVEVVYK